MVLKTLSIRQRKSDPWEIRQQMKAALGFPQQTVCRSFPGSSTGSGVQAEPSGLWVETETRVWGDWAVRGQRKGRGLHRRKAWTEAHNLFWALSRVLNSEYAGENYLCPGGEKIHPKGWGKSSMWSSPGNTHSHQAYKIWNSGGRRQRSVF